MRAGLGLLALSLALAACGAGGERSGGGPASTSAAGEPTRSVSEEEAEAQLPPAVVLVSGAGEQHGVQGSSCLSTAEVALCTDTPRPRPERLSVVRPGEAVQVVVDGVDSVRGKIHVLRLGCRKELLAITATEASTSWTVDLDPGAYELEVFARFEGAEKSGDTSAALGLLVDGSAPLALVTAPAGRCQSR